MNVFIRKRLALLLSLLLVLSSLPIISVSADSGLPITYEFNNAKKGTAGGTIAFTPNFTGTVDLFWGSGELKLTGYSEFGSLSVTNGIRTEFSVQEFTAIPAGVTQVMGFNGSTMVFSYDLPVGKLFDYGEKVLTFGALSDAHFGTRYGSRDIPRNAFNKAAGFLGAQAVDLIAMPGDISNDGSAADFSDYQVAVNSFNSSYPNIPVYTTTGNHDASGISRWSTYTSDSVNYTGTYVRKYAPNNLDFTVDVGGGNVFIFLNQQRWADDRIFEAGQLDWLAGAFAENYDKRVYFFTHQYLVNTSGDVSNGYYSYNGPMPSSEGQRVLQLLETYPNVMMFTGHSHWMYYLQFLYNHVQQKYNNTYANIFDGGGQYGTMVHVGSVTEPRDLLGTNNNRTDKPGVESEGYLVDVYGDCLVLKGYDFQRNRYLAFANYIVENPLSGSGDDEAVEKVIVDPTSATLLQNSSLQLNASVVGNLPPESRGITWESGSPYVTVSQTGLVTVTAAAPAGAYTITARSQANTSKYAETIITVLAETPITGAGTKADPYIIANEIHFLRFTNNMISNQNYYNGRYLKQTADLDMSNISGYNGIGSDYYFKGFYDGGGHIINVSISTTGDNCIFPRLGNLDSGSIVMNLGTTGSVSGNQYAAGISRSMGGSDGTNAYIINCWSTVNVTATTNAAGITNTIRGAVVNCVFAGNLAGSSRQAITGSSGTTSNTINAYCYNTGGTLAYSTGATLVNLSQLTSLASTLNDNLIPAVSYLVISAYTHADFIPWVQDYLTGYPIFADDIVRDITVDPVTVSMARGGTQQLTATVIGNLLPDAKGVVWESSGGANVSVSSTGLVTVAASAPGGTYTITARAAADQSKFAEAVITVEVGGSITGSGTKADPFIIANEANFLQFTNNMMSDPNFYNGKYLKQTADINMVGVSGYNGIGSDYFFKGFYDGGGHIINVSISTTGDNCIFPRLGNLDSGSIVMNLGTTGSVSGNQYAAGISRSMGGSDGTNAYIINCWSTVNVTATTNAAGITNTIRGAVVNCVFAGNLTGSSRQAITGSSGTTSNTINAYCYNTGGTLAYSTGATLINLSTLTTTMASTLNGNLDSAVSYLAISAYTRADLLPWVQDYLTGYPVFVDGIVRDVTVSPGSVNLAQGGTQQLTATVTGNLLTASKTVTWESAGGANVSVSATGLVTVAAGAPVGSYTITARSTADTTKFAQATINVSAASAITGSGTKADPYIIATAAAFLEFTNNMLSDASGNNYNGKYFKQTADINMAGVSGYNGINSNYYFRGYYDGAGHVINVNISGAAENCIFPRLSNTGFEGYIINLGTTGRIASSIGGGTLGYAGGISRSQQEGALIVNCWSTIDLSADRAAGITPTIRGAVVNCVFAGSLVGPTAAGAIAHDQGTPQNTLFCHFYNSNGVTLDYTNGASIVTLTQLTTTVADSLNSRLTDSAGYFSAASGFTRADLVEWAQDYLTGYPVFVDGIVRDVTVAPGSATLPRGDSQQLTATVIGNLLAAAKTVTWASSDSANVPVSTTGLVTVAAGAPNGSYTITVTSTVDNTKSAQAAITVAGQTDAEAVAEAKAALTWDTIRNANVLQSAVTTNLNLLTSGSAGTTISWYSNNAPVISTAGVVTRPPFTANDANVTITATISKNAASDTVTFSLTVLKNEQTDAEAVAEAKAALTWDVIRNANVLQSAVTTNLILPADGISGTSIGWMSDNLPVVSADGIVTRPLYNASNADVRLTATITKGLVTDYVTFNLTILKNVQTDAEAVAEAKAALTWDMIRDINVLQTSVTMNLDLITAGAADTGIEWSSNNTSVVTTSGIVTRPHYSAADAEVTLTATIRKGLAYDYVTFNIIVIKNVQTDAEAVAEIKALLTWDAIRGANTWQTAVTNDLTLITTGALGVSIAWASDNTAVLSDTGAVTRPLSTESDAPAQLVATITKGDANDQVVFDLIILKLSDAAGIVVDGLQIVPNGANAYYAAVTIHNNTQAPAAGIMLIIAAYDGSGKMVSIQMLADTVDANGSKLLRADMDITGKNVHTLKAFVWDDYIPICPEATFILPL